MAVHIISYMFSSLATILSFSTLLSKLFSGKQCLSLFCHFVIFVVHKTTKYTVKLAASVHCKFLTLIMMFHHYYAQCALKCLIRLCWQVPELLRNV